jgi:ClpP class serine protease
MNLIPEVRSSLLQLISEPLWGTDNTMMVEGCRYAMATLLDPERAAPEPSADSARARAARTSLIPASGRSDDEEGPAVAIIPLRGEIFPSPNLYTEYFGGTAMSEFSAQVRAATNNPRIKSIILATDSGGGLISGVDEAAEAVWRARKQKEVYTHVSGNCGSAAYWIGSQSSAVFATPTSSLGSIGVLVSLTDMRPVYKRMGVRFLELTSKNAPSKRLDPFEAAGRKGLQQQLDAIEEVFLSHVARGRKVSEKTVAQNFGRGGVLVGRAAMQAGMCDAILGFDDMLEMATALAAQ